MFETAVPAGYAPKTVTVGSSCCTAAKVISNAKGRLVVSLAGKYDLQTTSQRWFATIAPKDAAQPIITLAMTAMIVPRAALVDSAFNTRVVVKDKPETWTTAFEIRSKEMLPPDLKPVIDGEVPGLRMRAGAAASRVEGSLAVMAFPVTFTFLPEGETGPRTQSLTLLVPGTDYHYVTQIAWSVEKPRS